MRKNEKKMRKKREKSSISFNFYVKILILGFYLKVLHMYLTTVEV